MNMHMAQNTLAETELRLLAATVTQIVSPSSNVPIIAIYQDSLLGSYRITREGVKFSPRDAMNLLMMYPNVNPTTLFARGRKDVTNFELLSQIMPPLTLKYKTKLWDADRKEDPAVSNNVLEIYNGRYIRGQIDKSVLGGASKGIIHRICNDYGKQAAADFIDNMQNIVTEYMKVSSYSVGVSDLMSNRETYTRIIQAIQDKELEVEALIQKLHAGAFENNTSFSNKTEFEAQVNNVLNDATKKTDEISRQSLNPDNRFLMIVNSGSKGSLLNISHMISCLGQVNVDSKRVPYGFDSRTLPHFTKFDDSPGARGFIKNSYIGGLNAHELFFHAMGGRIGLIDTAVKSVSWETPIVFIDHGKPIYTEIGRWIDDVIDGSAPELVQKYEEKNMELVNIAGGLVYVPTMNENGVVTWEEITAVTRHDPGNVLYEIKSLGGRSVIVTESKSLLIWNAEKRVFNEVLTPEIKVGDCLPVTETLCAPPTVLATVKLVDILPKTEYVYGTDFNIAVKMMQSDMVGRHKIPANWWETHNNVEFTLPYSKKASLQRAIVRSNSENVKSGYVYPYHGVRSEASIPEEFELNEFNGRFVGLFLADGHATNERVYITKNNASVQLFVKSWFDAHNIPYSEKTNVNSHGQSTTFQATNGVLARFLTKWLGKGSSEKHVPSEAFVAGEPFLKGLISGYFSGDGTISKNSIEVSSASKRLIEGINMILSRLGIFGKVFMTQLKSNNLGTKNIKPAYRLSIRSQWGAKFAEQIQLFEDNKQSKLSNKKWNAKHSTFQVHNNVVLDPIVEITPLSPDKYPKMYDLTIPSTLNFGLANGLQVRDTSQTGYIQRRLIKGLEDLKVDYDLTVRNSNGKVIQFSYGEDAFDPMFVENQSLAIVTMSTQDIYMHYDMVSKHDSDTISAFNKGASARMGKQKAELANKCKKYIDMMMDARDMAVKHIFKNKNVDSVLAPVAFTHIINNTQGNLGLAANSIVDITPLEAFQLIEEYYEKLTSLHFAPPNKLFETLYFYYLNPRELLLVKRFHRKGLILLLETVFLKYKQALIQPGEMVGVVAGQSIGEPTTQLTLNSFVYETEILVRDDNRIIKRVQIGDFAKWGIETTRKMEYMSDKDTTYAELSKFYEVPSTTEEGRTCWRRIEAVTKHPVINEDGTDTMLKVTTKGNREVIATKVKSFLRLADGKITEVNGADLNVGDYLPVSKKALDYAERDTLDLREILSPAKFIYGTEMEKARSVVNEHQWWSKHSGKTFTLPYSRSDSAYCVLQNTKTRPNQIVYKPGFVYTMSNNICNYEIPEFIPLDYEFGYLVGAYCAEGCMTKHQVSIANNDSEYLKPIETWCARYNLTTKIYCHKNKIQEGWTSQDIRIYSTLLSRILESLCGKLSHNKCISDLIVFSNRQCLLGFLDAYIGGDGTVTKRNDRIEGISMSSVSLKMISQVQLILKNFDVIGKIHKPKKMESNSRGSKDIKQLYMLVVTNEQSKKLARMLNLSIKSKQERIATLLEQKYMYEYCKSDLQIPNLVDGELVMEPRCGRCPDMEFDQIVSIEEVPNTTEYAYDLTVEDTRNFDCANGLAVKDTFHTAGVASKSNVTRGVPRIEEILRLTKNPKNPSMTVFLKSVDESNPEKAKQFANMMEHTKLGDVASSVQICFDPDEFNTRIVEDRVLVEQFYEFSRMIEECNGGVSLDEPQTTKSKWVVRMEMDTEALLDKNITMDDINFTIKNGSNGQDVDCVYADYNSDKLVFRVRMSNIASAKKRKGVAEPLDQTDEIHLLKKFQDDLLSNTVLRGVSGIKNVLPRKLNNMISKVDGKYEKKETWVLDTTGSNLLETLGLDYIDSVRTFSNDIREVFNVLGIEAARQIIHDEIVDVLEFSGAYANYHHLSLLCDRMTTKKDLVSIFRTGLFSDDIGPIAKATFEVHTEVLLDAARFGEADNMRGVSANVMCGQPGYYGTNAFQLVLDMSEMAKLTAQQVAEKVADPMSELFGTPAEDSDVCPRSKIEIKNNIGGMKRTDPGLCNDDYNAGF